MRNLFGNIHRHHLSALYLSCMVFVSCFAGALHAQNESAESAKKNLLVLSLKRSASIDADTAKLLDEVLAVELAKYKESVNTMTDADIKRILALEVAKTAAGCDDTGCMSEIADALGARYVVNGRVGELGGAKVMTLSLYDAEKNESLERLQLQDDDLQGLSKKMQDSVAKLLVPVLPDDARLPTSMSSNAGWVWSASFISAGVVVAVGGLAFDLFSETSHWTLGCARLDRTRHLCRRGDPRWCWAFV